MNLFYKYSHLQRFEQQNEKDGRNVKDNKMRNEKGRREMGEGDGRRRWEKEMGEERWEKEKKKKKKRLPAWNNRGCKLNCVKACS